MSSRARHVQQVSLGVIQLGVVYDALDALLGRKNLVVAGHHGDGSILQPLGAMHRHEV